jgi:hypothetical protein
MAVGAVARLPLEQSSGGPRRSPPRRSPGRPPRSNRRSPAEQWNVLAEELVSYPPCDSERVRSAPQLVALPVPRSGPPARRPANAPSRLPAGRLDTLAERPRIMPGGTRQTRPGRAARRRGLASQVGTRPARAVPARPRGLRRLLPGAATLAALGSLWLGAGALSAAQQPRVDVIPGSVRIHGGYLYVVRPGDTLWEIASRVQPGGDPRPLVDRLQAQLHGAVLVAGDRITLP